ncbi:anti-sigma factor family protein [Bacillus horti]|uniref:Anti-sigma-W factor RsiW n=1 Tax=Caldalkalibacillus horti TaxID=77523 RepID=A0ABT9VT16_9BACI|nr:zf-HC2 domain-containing protein [Bacillus horti]MDQ0164118.1 hypothetical protein [Bacillus horti]
MKCEEVNDLINRELDGDLNEDEQRLLKQHLDGCSDCTELLENLRMVTVQLRSLPKVNPPIDIVNSILPDLEEWENQQTLKPSSSNFSAPIQEEGTSEGKEKVDLAPLRTSEQNKHKNTWLKKKWWIPGSAIAAAVLAIYFGTAFPTDQNQLFFTADDSAEIRTFDAKMDDSGLGNEMAETESYDSSNIPEEESTGDMAITSEEGGSVALGQRQLVDLVSPDQEYIAIADIENHKIDINDFNDTENKTPIYSTQLDWDESWFISYMDWVADDQLHIELYDSEQDEYQYLLIDVTEQSEELLDEPYSNE